MSKILIVEDEEVIVIMLKRRLIRHGHEIHIAKSGKVGIAMALELQPDLILMDMLMPEMSGSKATHNLREQGYQGLIVALTASALSDDVNKALDAGCNYFMSKPISSDFEIQLENLIQEFNESH